MTLSLLVAGRSTGTFGTFEVVDGNVSKNRTAILTFFNETTALVPMTARSAFTTGEEHAAFDATLMALSTVGVGIQYVESIGKFMDPKARFAEWLKGDLTPASVGLKLTQEELAVPSAYESVRQKFIAMFTAPTPKLSDGGIDVLAIFGPELAVKIDAWRIDQSLSLTRQVLAIVDRDPSKNNLLRLVNTGSSAYRVENAGGYSMTRTKFLAAYNEQIKPIWDRTPPNGEIGELGRFSTEAKEKGYGSARYQVVSIRNNSVEIGCQTIPRAEIERIVAQFAGLGIDK